MEIYFKSYPKFRQILHLMIIHNFDIDGTILVPLEANSILLVDPYAVLPHSVTGKCLKSIPGRNAKFIQR